MEREQMIFIGVAVAGAALLAYQSGLLGGRRSKQSDALPGQDSSDFWPVTTSGGSKQATVRYRFGFRLTSGQISALQTRLGVQSTGTWNAATERAFQVAAAAAGLPPQVSQADFNSFVGTAANGSTPTAANSAHVAVARRLQKVFTNRNLRNATKASEVAQAMGRANLAYRRAVRDAYNAFGGQSFEQNLRNIAKGMSATELSRNKQFASVLNSFGI